VRAGLRLGPFLCWAVVFADIGTSVYYTPGILYGQVGVHAAPFVTMTLVVFVLLCVKYAEVAIRYPEGGGVVTVATRAASWFAIGELRTRGMARHLHGPRVLLLEAPTHRLPRCGRRAVTID
jgi:hypothetical protein